LAETATKQNRRITVAMYAEGAGVGIGVPPVAGYDFATKFISIDAFENFAEDMREQQLHVIFANSFSPKLGRLLLHIRGTQFHQLPAIVIVCDEEPSEDLTFIGKGLGCTSIVVKAKFEKSMALIAEEAIAIHAQSKLHDEFMARFDTAVLNQEVPEARRSMDRLLLLDERNSYMLPLVTRMFRDDARFDDSAEFVERCALNFPDSPAIRIAVAMLRFDQGRFESAHTILMDMGLKNPTLISYILMNGMGPDVEVETFTGLSGLRKSVYSVRAVRQALMSWMQTAKEEDTSVKKFAKSCLDTLKNELGGRPSNAGEMFSGNVEMEVMPEIMSDPAESNVDSSVNSNAAVSSYSSEDNMFSINETVADADAPIDLYTADSAAIADATDTEVVASKEVMVVSEDGSIEFDLDLGDDVASAGEPVGADAYELDAPGLVTEDAPPKIAAVANLSQKSKADADAAAAADADAETGKELLKKAEENKKKAEEAKKKTGEFEIPADARPTAARPRMPDFSKIMSMLKSHMEAEERLNKVIVNAPDRSVEGRVLVYHPYQQGGALLSKNIEDLGCPNVEAVETRSDVLCRLRSRDIFCLVMWVLPDKEEASDLLADVNSAKGADCKSVLLLSQNHDAIKKSLIARPYVIFDHGSGDTGTRSKIGRAMQQALSASSFGQTARQVLSCLLAFDLKHKNERKEAKDMLATLEKFPGKKAWTETLRLEIAIHDKDAAVIKIQKERLEKAYSSFHPAIFAVAKAIYEDDEMEVAATYLLKNICSSRLASPERFFQAGKLLIEWRCENGLAFLLQSWTEQKRFVPDQNWNYLMSCYYDLRDGVGSESITPYLLTAINLDPARYEFWCKLGEKFEADRHYYRAEEVWANIRTLRGADALHCDLSLAKCFFEGRKVRKADALVQDILRRHPDCQEARELAHKYRRQIAS
jgi:hypothetical protein